MALHNITEDGMLHWRCHHKKCAPLQAHISHDQVEYVDHDLVALPPCDCGSRCFVKVKFTEEELQAPNMVEYGMVPTEMELPHAITGEPVKVLIPALKPIGKNPFVTRHLELARQLDAIGKVHSPPVVESEAADASTAAEA